MHVGLAMVAKLRLASGSSESGQRVHLDAKIVAGLVVGTGVFLDQRAAAVVQFVLFVGATPVFSFGLNFLWCNREPQWPQTSSGKFLRWCTRPVIHGNALGLWCVYTESIAVNYWQLWNRLTLWVQRLQKARKEKNTQHSHCSSKR